jgi:putative methyltransferase (TIGR04325 family)
MATLPLTVRAWVPPAVYTLVERARRGRTGLSAPVESWSHALAASTGYDATAILDRVDARSRGTGDAACACERDGVLLDDVAPPFPLIASLLRTAAHRGDGQLSVIDFGGSLGSSYRQCREFLTPLTVLRWQVIEQPHYVTRGRAAYQTDTLSFFMSMDEAAQTAAPDVILFSGVLQYLDDPAALLENALRLAPRAIVIDRTPVSDLSEEAFTIQHVPADIFKARLALRIFGAGQIDAALPGYRRIATFDTVDPDQWAGSLLVKFKGAIYERIGASTGHSSP